MLLEVKLKIGLILIPSPVWRTQTGLGPKLRIYNLFLNNRTKTKKSLSSVGELTTGRRGHGAIYDGSKLLVIGGYPGYGPPLKTEVCTLLKESMNCVEQNPVLASYYYYPELFRTPDNFCK